MNIFDLQGNANVICYAVTDGLIHTDKTSHVIGGRLNGKFKSLVICQYPNTGGYYLLYFNDQGEEVTDTWHETLEDAKDQAEYEYSGITNIWITVE
jgi:hypothetical protein